jgi:hypothetical protein
MSDLPTQGLLQQLNAKAHGGEYLEVLGKKAAADWSAGQHKSLTAAVTETVKQAQLSPEQVKRVVEFANTSAYLDEFKKESAPHHVVEFQGGPADVSEILKDLNDGGGGSVFDRGTGDYNGPPNEMKVSSSKAEEELFALLNKTAAAELPYENPHGEVIELREKLAGASEHLQSQVSGLEILYADLADRTYHQVKQAALSGVSLGEVLQAWESVAPSDEHIKIAFSLLTPRLLRDRVFYDVGQMTASVDKTAGARMVNPAHPLVGEFGEFCEVVTKLAELRGARREIQGHLAHLSNYLKTASLAGDVFRGATSLSSGAGRAARPFVEKALGETAGAVAEKTLKYAPHIGLAVAANEGRRWVKGSPNPVAGALRKAYDVTARQIPGTQQHYQREWEIQSGQ